MQPLIISKTKDRSFHISFVHEGETLSWCLDQNILFYLLYFCNLKFQGSRVPLSSDGHKVTKNNQKT